MDQRRPDMRFCLGDLVGYAPWPNEVVDMIRGRAIATIAGNYDEGVGLNSPDCGCAYKTIEEEARGNESIAFTNKVVTESTREYLRGLPRHMRVTLEAPRTAKGSPYNILMVHGSARRVNQYLFADFPEQNMLRMMAAENADVMLFGHTHKPYHKAIPYDEGGATKYRHAINIGSVGKPKDGDRRAGYVILHADPAVSRDDPDGIRVEFIRVDYDVEQAARAIEESPLPDAFADMLRGGY
jgi:diadenosine tetraphosphatase ApaH/serine/threonine PP2A family protein phosphatase